MGAFKLLHPFLALACLGKKAKLLTLRLLHHPNSSWHFLKSAYPPLFFFNARPELMYTIPDSSLTALYKKVHASASLSK